MKFYIVEWNRTMKVNDYSKHILRNAHIKNINAKEGVITVSWNGIGTFVSRYF